MRSFYIFKFYILKINLCIIYYIKPNLIYPYNININLCIICCILPNFIYTYKLQYKHKTYINKNNLLLSKLLPNHFLI